MKSFTSYNEVPATPQTDLSTDTVARPVQYDYSEFAKVYMFGEKNSGFRSNGALQNYAQLKQHNLENRTVFSDENFAPEKVELPKLNEPVEWKRPFQIVDTPQFFVDGACRFDINQGKLGDCWFLAAVENLTFHEKLFNLVVPNDQSENFHIGIFHFRFWQFGRWVDVVIDDQLPTINNELAFLKSTDSNEFWPSLLEKAYAKFYGSYKHLEGGQMSEAFEDLCGGLSEYYEADRPEIFEIIEMSFKRKSFIGCSIISQEVEGRRADGLVTMHAYGVTAIEKIRIGESDLKLIRLRNPWGNNTEWNGKWSDLSSDWDTLPKAITQKLQHKKPDGEFWMEVSDFQRCFTFVDICHLNPSAYVFSDKSETWNVNMFEGTWVPNVTAGGGLRTGASFCNNPQYHITIQGDQKPDSTYAVVIGLMQKNRRAFGENELPLEINIFRTSIDGGQHFKEDFFEANQPIVHVADQTGRQLTLRVMLPAGRYCIIPSTVQPNVYANYLLRIYSEATAHIIDNDDEIGYDLETINHRPKVTTRCNLETLFSKLAKNTIDSEIGWYGVQKALHQLFGTKQVFCFTKPKIQFSDDTCKHIVALWDANYSGRLDVEEFKKLMDDVTSLRVIFRKFDADNSGQLDGFELRNLLSECGYSVNREILTILMLRYGRKGYMSFENFIVCAFKLKTMIDEFRRRRTLENNDHINVNRRDWLQMTLYT